MPDRSRNSEENPPSEGQPDEADSPYPFPTESESETFSSVALDEPPIEATPDEESSSPTSSVSSHATAGAAPIARLTVDPPDDDRRTLEFTPPRLVIGRTDADLVVDDPFLSTWHAQLFVEGDSLVLADMNSYNGVFLGIADELVLEDRDELVMGQQRFVFRTEWDEPKSAEAPDRNVPRLGAPIAGSPVRLIRMLAGERIGEIREVGERMTIGGDGCDFDCPEDLSLSTPHAEIIRERDSFLLRDLESDYGTFIRIHDAVEVVDGDCFVVGRTRLDVTFL